VRATERHHYTSAQVEEHAREALEMLARLDPPEDLRAVVWQSLYNNLAAKQIFYEQVNAGMILNPRLQQ